MAENLVIYYSRRGQNYVGGNIRNLEKGNAELIAGYIRDAVDADVFRIDTVKPYSEDYRTCTEEAKRELQANARPELKERLGSVSKYGAIFVAGPNWWGVYPMAVYAQLEKLNLAGKTVHYVVTHEGSGLGDVPKTMAVVCKGAKIGSSLAVRGGDAPKAENIVARWAKAAVQ